MNGLRRCGVYICNGILAIKKNKIMSAAAWMDLEIIIPSEVRQRKISYDITCMKSFLKGYK